MLNDRLKQTISVIAKSGANIYNNAHYYKVKNAVKKAKSPVVIVWLGTCDITKKKGEYVSVKSYPYQKIEFALNKYRTLKSRPRGNSCVSRVPILLYYQVQQI